MLKINKHKWSMKLTISILPLVVLMIIVFFLLTSRSILSITQTNMSLHSENCIDELGTSMDNVISELNIYKKVIESIDSDEELTHFLTTTYQANAAYPMGIYLGDDTGVYIDASGWVPDDPDWILVERPWYVDGKDSNEFVLGEPYIDSMLGTLCVSASVRLDYDGAVRVMATDIYLDKAQDLITEISENNSIEGALLLTENENLILADTDRDMNGQVVTDGNSIHNEIAKLLSDKKLGQTEIKCGGTKYYITVMQHESTGWYLVTYVKKKTVLGYLYNIEFFMMIIAVAVTVSLSFITKYYAGKMANMQKKAKTDTLTGILNREGLEEASFEILNADNSKGALIILDMDNFKSINDSLGHPEGDKVLIEYADLLTTFFNRRTDVVARIGGDEFAVFMGSDINYDTLSDILRRFSNIVKEHYRKDYAKFRLSSSIGAAFVHPDITFHDLYRIADKALYDVKDNGKNGFNIAKKGETKFIPYEKNDNNDETSVS